MYNVLCTMYFYNMVLTLEFYMQLFMFPIEFFFRDESLFWQKDSTVIGYIIREKNL